MLLLTLLGTTLRAQAVRINEVVASNSGDEDEDGDTPDWLELRNFGAAATSIAGWQLTDDLDEEAFWTFPDVTLAADEHLRVWASGKDRNQVSVVRTLITQGDEFRYLVPTQPVNGNWRNNGFDDSGWGLGSSGFGYADGDDATVVPNGTSAVFVRKKITVTDAAAVEKLLLDIDYDDGFVAYLNGTEIARANMDGATPAYNAFSPTDREARIYSNGLPERYVVDNPAALLQNGENVLCIQVHNVGNTSSDMSLIPFLSAVYNGPTTDGDAPNVLLPIPANQLHTDFKISTGGETIYLLNATGAVVDSLFSGELTADISRGIPYNEPDQLVYFSEPTPGAPNTGPSFAGIVTDQVSFSHPGGTTGPVSLTLSGATAPAVIRYTLDARLPTVNDPVYGGPLAINATTVVRARIFQAGFLPSATASRSFIVGQHHDLPVVSLVTDPDNLFDNEEGIYVAGDNAEPFFPFFGSNFWQDWERPAHFSLYGEDGPLEVELNAGIKIFGGWSRGQAQKSFSVFARKQYGADAIEAPLFATRPYDSYQSVVLRNSGNDFLNSNMRDRTLTSLMEGAGLELQANRPAVTYINGEYWGFYNLREKVNEHFLADKFDLATDELNIVELNAQTVHGDNAAYLELIDFVTNNNLVVSANYEQVAEQVDIENFIIYYVAQIYFNNTDWPGNNIKYWQPVNGKWRWILFDTDFGFGVWSVEDYFNNTLAFALNDDGPNWPNPPWSTLLFRKLMENTSFRNDFVNRYADEMNSRFLPQRVSAHVTARANEIQPEITRHFNRWGGDPASWQQRLEGMRTFGNLRPLQAKRHVRTTLGLPAFHRLVVNVTDADEGYVRINDRLTVDRTNWRGDYFESVPFAVEAIAEPGYVFSHWESSADNEDASTASRLSINITAPMSLRPVFTEDPTSSTEAGPVAAFRLFPNPSADRMNLSFSLRARSQVRGTLYDGKGVAVRQMIDQTLVAGPHELTAELGALPAGVYFLELRVDGRPVIGRRWVKK